MVGGMFIHSDIRVYGQEQLQQQSTFSPTFSSTNQTSEGRMTSFDLENCGFASRKQLFYSKAWIPSHIGG